MCRSIGQPNYCTFCILTGMKRRQALKNTALGLGGLMLGSACQPEKEQETANEESAAMETTRNFGVQLFTIPGLVDQDLKGTLKTLGEIGYKEVEFFGRPQTSREVI